MQVISSLPCPACGTSITFQHQDTTMIPCRCGSVLCRNEAGFLQTKPYYIILDPVDFIQPGTTGEWKEKSFKVLGRIRVWAEENVFNYWTIVFTDGEFGYLFEGYGWYVILQSTSDFPLEDGGKLSGLNIGDFRTFTGQPSFLLEKKWVSKRWEVEGESLLPECQNPLSIYHFASEQGHHLQFIQYLPKLVRAYCAHFSSYADLKLHNLRSAQTAVKSVRCGSCQETIQLKGFPFSQSCACHKCGKWYVYENDDFRRIQKNNEIDATPDIPIGSIGQLFDTTYEVVGFMVKQENTRYASQWREYTLYNKHEGYAFLSEYDGHWIFLWEEGDSPVLPHKNVKNFTLDGEPFQLYNSYSYTIVHASGEFPGNVYDSTETYIKEFISPPEMWSQEKNQKEGIVWYFGEHISSDQLKKAFGDRINVPPRSGIGVVEPRFFISPSKLVFVAIVALVVLAGIHVIISSTKRNQVLLNETLFFPDSANLVSLAAPKIVNLDKWRSNLEFAVYAPVDNDWLELNATLVNTKTGTEYTLEKGVEYYSGYSEGEYWTEGSRSAKAYMTQIPAGTYCLQLQGARDPLSNKKPPDFEVIVTYDVTNDRNLVASILLLLIWPFIQYVRTNNIEKQRWENSPYTPYTYED